MRQGRGAGSSARPPGSGPRNRRARAGVVLFVVTVLGVASPRWMPSAPRAPETPYDAGPMHALDRAGDTVSLGVDEPVLVLYVSETCRYCAAELHAWDSVAEGSGGGPVAVLSPDSQTGDVSYLPPGFRRRWLHDTSGSVARALGLAGVPFLALVEPPGIVREAWMGTTDAARRADLLRRADPSTQEAS